MDDFLKVWPLVSMCIGAVAAYYGARNAMQERLARLEAQHEAFAKSTASDLHEIRARTDDAHARINRVLEMQLSERGK